MSYGVLLIYSWDEPGVYNVTLTVTDNENKTDSVSAQVPVVVNGPPQTPIKPFGRNSGRVGRKYTYSTHTSDPNGDQIKYGWNWTSRVDGKELTVDEWTNLCESGKIIETSHIWLKKGSYEVRVLAMDEHGSMSSWSDPLPITMFKNKNLVVYEHFIIIVEKFSKY